MASIRPSQYAMLSRTDGGPFLDVMLVNAEGNIVDPGDRTAIITLVYYSDVNLPPGSLDWHLIMDVTTEKISLYPKLSRADSDGYGESRYGSITCIQLIDPDSHPYDLPHDQDSLEEMLSELPPGFKKDWRFGVGFLYEYRFIPETISSIEHVHTLVIDMGGTPSRIRLEGNYYYLGVEEFLELCSRIVKISRRHQRNTAEDKKLVCYAGLLHEIDPELFPPRSRRLPPEMLNDLISLGRDKLSKQDERAATHLVASNVASIARNEPHALFELKAEIERVTLKQLIVIFDKMISQKLSEGHWHEFFAKNIFILDMAFGYPVKVVASNAYVGGKQVSGQGGQYTDFLMAAKSTGNLALIEIKHPEKAVLSTKEYRAGVYGPSSELGGAVTQALSQRAHLLQNVLSITSDIEDQAYAHAVPILILIGQTPDDHKKRRSFEQFRNSLKDIHIVTFDELQARLASIHHALQSEDAD